MKKRVAVSYQKIMALHLPEHLLYTIDPTLRPFLSKCIELPQSLTNLIADYALPFGEIQAFPCRSLLYLDQNYLFVTDPSDANNIYSDPEGLEIDHNLCGRNLGTVDWEKCYPQAWEECDVWESTMQFS